MAENIVGPVMEKLINAGFAYLKDQVRWQTGMKEELQSLRKIHPQIKAVVSAYSKAQIDDSELNKWYWQLRDAIDEADDVFDEFEYWKRDEKQLSSKNKSKRKVRGIMKYLKKKFIKICKRALKIDPNLKRLEAAVQNLYKISAEVSNFLHLLDSTKQEEQQQQLELHKKRETGSMPTNDLIGRGQEMEFVRQWLRNPYDQTEITNSSTDLYSNISLLSVVGLGGMGKTTLLQHVYEDGVTKEFDVKMWVCVSTDFDSKTVVKNILKSLKKQASVEEPLESLQRSLQSEVMSRRFLLVLDDIWEADETKWENVLAPLHYGRPRSKILITTRMESVASEIAKIIKKSKEILPLKGLEEDDCFKLLNIYAFAGVKNPDDEFRSIIRKMVEKLSGSPLAAKVIGGILNSYVDKSYWTKVLNTNVGNIGTKQNPLLSILRLSYIYLPNYLKNCFTFCCIFSQNHEFDKDDLVRMWVALGFIQSSNIQGENLEETGRRYFDILVQKSFFDEFRTVEDEAYYKMHDLLHELAQSVSTQECFKIVDDEESSIPPETIRHLSIHASYDQLKAVFQKMGKFKNLRSLYLSTRTLGLLEDECSEILKASKSIHLLVISCDYMLRYPEKIHETIGSLIHLRYLKVEFGRLTFKLSRSVSHLYHLQFIISKKLRILEMDNIGWKELIPNENCQLIMDELIIKDPSVLQLRNISSIRYLKIAKNDELVSLPSEAEQWFLQRSSTLLGLAFQKLQSLQCLPSSLPTISSLSYLKLKNISLLKSLPDFPSSLELLKLYNLESLQWLPSSLSTISSLVDLRLRNIPLLKSLPDLPSSLISLKIDELKSLQCHPSSFSTITRLRFLRLSNIPLLKSLPHLPCSLELLVLAGLESLEGLPSSFSAISSLKALQLYNIPLLKSLPHLPYFLEHLELGELQSLERLPSSLSTISSLTTLKLSNIPLLTSLPRLPSSLQHLELIELESLQRLPSPRPASLNYLSIEDCHPRLMERYKNINRARI